jgi:hypothetical protein
MIKTNFSKFWHIFLGISLLFSSCIALNDTYCTPPNFTSNCKIFDRKTKIMINESSSCTGGELKKGKYKRLGNLIVLDLIPYQEEKNYSISTKTAEKNDKDSINVKIKVIDNLDLSPAIGAYVSFRNENMNFKCSKSTDIEGFVALKIGKKELPCQIETSYVGFKTVAFELRQPQDCSIELFLKDNGFLEKSKRTGREYYRVKKVKKDSLIFQQIFDVASWKIDANWYRNWGFYSKKYFINN